MYKSSYQCSCIVIAKYSVPYFRIPEALEHFLFPTIDNTYTVCTYTCTYTCTCASTMYMNMYMYMYMYIIHVSSWFLFREYLHVYHELP